MRIHASTLREIRIWPKKSLKKQNCREKEKWCIKDLEGEEVAALSDKTKTMCQERDK